VNNVFSLGKTIGLALAKLAGASAEDLEQALKALEDTPVKKQSPTNAKSDSRRGMDGIGDQVIWGPEVAVDSRNDLSTWGGYDSVSRY